MLVLLRKFDSSPAKSGQSSADILQEVMSEMTGCFFTCQDPDDGTVYETCIIK